MTQIAIVTRVTWVPQDGRVRTGPQGDRNKLLGAQMNELVT